MHNPDQDSYNSAVARPKVHLNLRAFIPAVACFCIGLSITFILYQYFVKLDQERLRERVLRGTQVLASSESRSEIDADIQRAFAEFESVGLELERTAAISGKLLTDHVWQSSNPLVRTISLRYLPKARFNSDVQRYEMMGVDGEWTQFDIPILNFNSQSQLVADDTRATEYYPVLYTNGESILSTVAGVNFLSDPQYALALRHARDTGVATYRTSYPRGGAEEPFVLHVMFKAVYRAGTHPQSVEARRADAVGFLSAVVMIESATFIDYIPESYKGIHALFLPVQPGFTVDDFGAEGRALIDSGDFAYAPVRRDNAETIVVAKPSVAQTRALQTNDRWWALSIGALLTVWMSSLLLVGSRRSQRMAQTIDERTSALAERTHKLEEVNSALQKSERRYRALATNVHDVIYSHDTNGVITYISAWVKQALDYDADDMIGQPIFQYLDQPSADRVRAGIARAKNNLAEFDDGRTYENDFVARDGSTRTFESTVSILSDAPGALSGFLVVSRDISDRKKDQTEREKLKQAVQQAQKMEAIGTLAGGIAHDFNNLLVGILGHAELIKLNPALDADTEDSATVIETAALRGRQLTTQLLGFARKGQFEQKNVHINALILETVQLFERTLGKNIIIASRLCEEDPVVLGDPGQINQVLLNLAVNARDAMPQGGRLSFETAVVTIDASDISLQLPKGNYCEIKVADTGVGISKEKQQRIFEPFFTDKDEGKGTGLGLAMVYGVVNNHGGRITVYSEVDHGAVFRILLPLSAEQREMEPVITDTATHVGKGKVMVVDDEALVRELTESLLIRLGFETVCFSNGQDAINYFRDHAAEIDLVIMDLVMPELDGRSCLHQMYRVKPELKAILTSGFTHDSVTPEKGDEHVPGFIQKPFTLSQFSKIVTGFLAKK